MPTATCESCFMRRKYDKNPRSFFGRLWRWHIGWCPGFRSYMNGLSEAERNSLIARYKLPADKWEKNA